MKKTIILAVISICSHFLMAQGNEEELRIKANAAFDAAKYLEAQPLYSQLVSLHPKNEDYNWRFGACTIFAGSDYETAIKHLRFAAQKASVDPRAHYYLGLAYQLNYQFDDAIKSFNNFINLGDPKLKANYDVARRIEQSKNGKGLLDQVKDLVVLEKTGTSEDDFFRFFNLDGLGGKILAKPEELKTKEDKKRNDKGVIYYPGNASLIYFSSYGKDGASGKDIYKAYILPGGKFSEPELLKGGVNTSFDEDFAFMHPDGKTFYFASKGHNSMGGFDIFKSVYDEAKDSFSPAVNLDFAINTPDDDILFVTDSLQHLACFASGRSSAMGELHVYKVRVEGIPVQVVFIQGDFISEIAPDSKKAKIKVFDELTGRPVENTFSSVDGGDYVLTLPKSGRYRMEVEGEQSPIVHEGFIDIPVYNEPVVLKQQLRLVRENGVEKLIINNFFEEPLTDRLAELTANMMRRKAGLDVNVSDELLAQLDNQDKLTVEQNEENAPQLAGFQDGVTLDQILSDMSARAASLNEQAKRSKERIDFASGYAVTEEEKGNELLRKAEALKSSADPERKDLWIEAMTEYQAMVKEAEQHLINAKNAYDVAKNLESKSAELTGSASTVAAEQNLIQNASSSGNMEQLVELLGKEKIKASAKFTGLALLVDEARNEARKSETENKSALEKLSKLREDEKELQVRLRSKERQKETASKKEKESIDIEISAINSDLLVLQEKIEKESQKVESTEQKRSDSNAQANIYESVILSDAPQVSPKKLSSAELQQKSSSISSSINKARQMQIRDEETLSLIGSETRVTNQEIVKEPLSENNSTATVEIKTLEAINKDYSASLTNIPAGLSSRENAYRMQQINASTVGNLNAREKQLIQMRKAPGANTAEIDKELSQISAKREEINSNQLSEETIADESRVNAELQKLGAKSPVEVKGMAWDNSIRSIALHQSVLANARQRKSVIDAQIISETDPVTIKNLSDEGSALSTLIKKANSDNAVLQNGINEFNSALNSQKDNKAKINLIDAYIKDLNSLIAHLEQSSVGMSADDKLRVFNMNNVATSELARVSAIKESFTLPSTASVNQNNSAGQNTTSVSHSVTPSVTPSVSPVPGLKGKPLPSEKGLIIKALVPDYPLEMVNKSGEGVIPDNDRAKYESALLAGLVSEIKNRETTLATTRDSSAAAQIENDLNVLRTLKRQTELRNMNIKSSDEPLASQSPVSKLTEEQKEIINYVNSPVETPDAKEAYESELFNDLVGNNEDPNIAIRNLEGIAEIHTEIDEKEAEIQKLAESNQDPGKQKKLDRQVEDLYARVGEMEVGNAPKIRQMAETRYAENQKKIEKLEDAKSDLLTENDDLHLKFDQNLSRAEVAMSDAKQMRENAQRISDPIEKNYRLREAFALESEAIEYQQQSITLLENIEMIAASQEQLAAEKEAQESAAEVAARMESELKSTQMTENNTNSDSAQSNASVNTNTTAKPVNEAVTTTTGPGNEKPVPAPTGMRPSVTDRSAGISINILAPERLLQDATVAANSSPEARAKIENSKEFKEYNQMIEKVSDAQQELLTALDERSQIVSELQTIEAQIEALENSLDSAASEAEAEGIRAEIKQLRAQADVLYARINALDRDIDSKEKLLGTLAADLQSRSEAITSMAVGLNAKPVAKPTIPAIPDEDRYWMYPEVLNADFFNFVNSSPYSASRPIPIDPVLPDGLIFKVQVGAFKNAIPQDLFGGFAPVCGESAGNGLTRYTAGLFLEFDNADEAKKKIREMGYSDAFVVAFYNGKRIPLYEAYAMAGRETPASLQQAASQAQNTANSNSGNKNAANANVPKSSAEQSSNNSNNQNSFEANENDVAYYTSVPDAAEANQVEALKGLFYTVQVGVYSKPVSASELFNISPLNSEKLSDGKVRYTTGVYNNIQEASARKSGVIEKGISDAFVTAYYNGSRISIQKASELFAQYGPEALAVTNALGDKKADSGVTYVVHIGTFKDQVPADAAKAMLYLEDSRGVVTKSTEQGTAYYTKEINSMESAGIVLQEFISYGVTSARIVKMLNGVEQK